MRQNRLDLLELDPKLLPRSRGAAKHQERAMGVWSCKHKTAAPRHKQMRPKTAAPFALFPGGLVEARKRNQPRPGLETCLTTPLTASGPDPLSPTASCCVDWRESHSREHIRCLPRRLSASLSLSVPVPPCTNVLVTRQSALCNCGGKEPSASRLTASLPAARDQTCPSHTEGGAVETS